MLVFGHFAKSRKITKNHENSRKFSSGFTFFHPFLIRTLNFRTFWLRRFHENSKIFQKWVKIFQNRPGKKPNWSNILSLCRKCDKNLKRKLTLPAKVDSYLRKFTKNSRKNTKKHEKTRKKSRKFLRAKHENMGIPDFFLTRMYVCFPFFLGWLTDGTWPQIIFLKCAFCLRLCNFCWHLLFVLY